MDNRLAPQGVILGRVLDEDGDPVDREHVSLVKRRFVAWRRVRAGGGLEE